MTLPSLGQVKRSCVPLFTMELEYIACVGVVQEVVWFENFLQTFEVVSHTTDPVIIYCDSMIALAYLKDLKYHMRSMHIETHQHHIRDIVAQKKVI